MAHARLSREAGATVGLTACANCGQKANSEAGCQNCGADPQTGVVPEAVLALDEKAKAARVAPAQPVSSYTPWWARLLATWIDMFLVLLATMVISLVLAASMTEADASSATGWVFWCGLFAYLVAMEATVGRTVGKMVFGAHVLKLDGNRIGLGRSLVRNVFKMAAIGGSLITLLCIVLSKHHQRIGDMVAGTVVVKSVPEHRSAVAASLTRPAGADTSPSQPVLIATFGSTTAWAGRAITFDNQQFVLGEHGAITATAVADYARLGQLEWAYDGLQDWVVQIAAGELGRERPSGAPHLQIDAFCPSCGSSVDPFSDSYCPACGTAQAVTA